MIIQYSLNTCFNGAATFQLRIADQIQEIIQNLFSFNGAATFQLRIVDSDENGVLTFINASMEPQLFSCGLNFNSHNSFIFYSRFNGAATFQLRIVYHRQYRGMYGNIASMEPQLFSCGLLNTIFGTDVVGERELQWSRNFSVAD